MDIRTDITVLFLGNRTEIFYGFTILEVARELIAKNIPLASTPLLISRAGFEKKLYYNQHTFSSYAQRHYSFKDVEKGCWCQGLYRNKTKLVTQRNAEVEPDSLWLKRNNILHLLDADNYITCNFNNAKNLFYQLE